MTRERFPLARVHPTALVEEGVTLGEKTSVWDNAHIRHGARIGKQCIIGEKTYIAYDVTIGDYCKLNASVYVCAGVRIKDYVMLSAHVVFTNDRFPRAFDRTLNGLATSDPTEETLFTEVGLGVTVGANATIGPGLTIGDYAMVGMGTIVTRDVPSHGLVIGNPSRLVGYVCACGPVVVKIPQWEKDTADGRYTCGRCGRMYGKTPKGIYELEGPKVDTGDGR